MPIAIYVPRLGWSMEQGVFQGWIKQPGDAVRPGDPLFRLEGDKAVQDVESVDEGLLHVPADAPPDGAEVAVGQVIGFLLIAGETPPTSCGPVPKPAAAVAPTATVAPAPVAPAPAVSVKQTPATVSPVNPPTPPAEAATGERPFASPSVRRLARELGVDLRQVKQSGQVAADDVYRHVAQLIRLAGGIAPADATAAAVTSPVKGPIPKRQRGLPTISPRAAQLAISQALDWTRLTGSGAGGRIREADVVAALQQRTKR